MKKNAILFGRIIPFILLILFVTACACKENPDKTGSDPLPGTVSEQPDILMDSGDSFPEPMVGSSGPAEEPIPYKIGLDVDERIVMRHKGHLKVWIAPENQEPELLEGKARDTATVPAKEMKSHARISIFAPDFKVTPSEPQITSISESGASVPFSVTPESEGPSEISAKVELFDNEELRGIPYSWTETVKVTVYVDGWEIIRVQLRQLGETSLNKFTIFLSALVALLLGMALYMIRKYLKKKTGYDQNKHGGDLDGQ